jgi:selenide, water dikinase
MSATETPRLTQFSRGAGCGCKIAPQVLKDIIGTTTRPADPKLLVGNDKNDDAAVYDLGGDTALVATTDFFMPVVDDAFDFGRIAAANAISDVYAMGGRPVLALAILGWPVAKLPPSLAARVMEGARAICAEAGIPLAGGHSVDAAEPIFGLAVNGLVKKENLKRNDGAAEGDLIFLTKPIGIGVLTTAQKRGVLSDGDQEALISLVTKVNSIGEKLASIKEISAMTDVTGFGLLGHLTEMADGSGLTAEISYGAVPKIRSAAGYLKQNTVPDATFRNWNAYEKKTLVSEGVPMPESFQLLPDPQTNGGLLFAVHPTGERTVAELLRSAGYPEHVKPIGRFIAKESVSVRVNV